MLTRSLSFDDDTAAILDAAPNKSRLAGDAIRWAAKLDLTESSVAELAELRTRLTALGVDEPLAAGADLAEAAVEAGTNAHQYLSAVGWSGGELLAAMNAMMGTLWQYGMPLGQQVALEMADGVALGNVDLAGWGVSPERWYELGARVASDTEQARALLDLARVFWRTQGSKIEQAMRRGLPRAVAP